MFSNAGSMLQKELFFGFAICFGLPKLNKFSARLNCFIPDGGSAWTWISTGGLHYLTTRFDIIWGGFAISSNRHSSVGKLCAISLCELIAACLRLPSIREEIRGFVSPITSSVNLSSKLSTACLSADYGNEEMNRHLRWCSASYNISGVQ